MSSEERKALQESWKEWGENPTGKTAVDFLSSLGDARRRGVEGETKEVLREMEDRAREELERLLEGLNKWPLETSLMDSEDEVKDFVTLRDKGQLALEMAREFSQEVFPSNWSVIGKIRNFLQTVDTPILLQPDLVKEVRQVMSGEDFLFVDEDKFWWLAKSQREGCNLPAPYRDRLLSQCSENVLEEDLRSLYLGHLEDCAHCQQTLEEIRHLMFQDLMEVFNHPPLAAAQADEIPRLSFLVWEDDWGHWQLRLYLSQGGPEEETDLQLVHQIGEKQEASLELAGEKFTVTKEGTIKVKREKLKEALRKSKGEVKLIPEQSERSYVLRYRGERK